MNGNTCTCSYKIRNAGCVLYSAQACPFNMGRSARCRLHTCSYIRLSGLLIGCHAKILLWDGAYKYSHTRWLVNSSFESFSLQLWVTVKSLVFPAATSLYRFRWWPTVYSRPKPGQNCLCSAITIDNKILGNYMPCSTTWLAVTPILNSNTN